MSQGQSNDIQTSRPVERNPEMTTHSTPRTTETVGRTKRVVLLSLALGSVLAAIMALVAGTARQAEAAFSEKIVFASNRTAGKKNLTNNAAEYDESPEWG